MIKIMENAALNAIKSTRTGAAAVARRRATDGNAGRATRHG
jgi:hypothetical protein